MLIGKVKGPIVSTSKKPSYKGLKLLLVKILDLSREETGRLEIVVDLVEAGEGDIVLVSREGGAIRKIIEDMQAPIRAYTIAIVDDWYIEEDETLLTQFQEESRLWE